MISTHMGEQSGKNSLISYWGTWKKLYPGNEWQGPSKNMLTRTRSSTGSLTIDPDEKMLFHSSDNNSSSNNNSIHSKLGQGFGWSGSAPRQTGGALRVCLVS